MHCILPFSPAGVAMTKQSINDDNKSLLESRADKPLMSYKPPKLLLLTSTNVESGTFYARENTAGVGVLSLGS